MMPDDPVIPQIPRGRVEWPAELQNLASPGNAFPLGENDLPLVTNFGQRQRYRYATYFKGLPNPIDTFYDKVFYGKVDRFQNVIVPKKDSNLIKQTSYDENVFTFDFVADAFFKLKRNLKIAGDSGGIEKNQTVLYNLQAVKGWYNYENSYNAILNKFIGAHDTYLKTLERRKVNKIVTFTDYANSVLNFLKMGTYKVPITLTEYVLSSATPVTLSGLVIETAQQSYSNDLKKYTNYFLDPNFSYYVRAARKFGFYVDKNGPWRLFADVFSPPMLDELNNSGHISGAVEKNFFNTYYDRTYTLDLPLLKAGLLRGFNKFAEINERITETVAGLSYRGAGDSGVGTVACGPAHTNLIGLRSQIPPTALDELENRFWFFLYLNIRMLESSTYYKNPDTLVNEALQIADAYSYNQGLIYINNLFKPYLYDERIFKSPLTKGTAPVRVGSVADILGAGYGNGGITSY